MSSDPEEVGRILKGIKKRYDKDKENWKVHGGIDPYGNHDLIIAQEPRLWWIKSKPIDPFRSISFGKEFTNIELKDIEREIRKEIARKNGIHSGSDVIHRLFGVSAPTEKELITAVGIQRFSHKEMNEIRTRVGEKFPGAEKKLKKRINESWKKYFSDRDNLYL